MQINGALNATRVYAPSVRTITKLQSLLEIMALFINVDVLDVLIISRIDKSPTQSL
jgi:hypothetical protein